MASRLPYPKDLLNKSYVIKNLVADIIEYDLINKNNFRNLQEDPVIDTAITITTVNSYCYISCTPPELKSIVNSALSDLIPKKSKRQYEKCYSEFKDWCDKQNVKTMSENILLAYLMQQSKVVKSSTLWSIYSMLKCLLNIREGIDVRKFLKLVPFLERKAVNVKKII
ncbi:hypothetical protein NQ317_013318 [Molorchus minor]|uniref:Uncharacterized protein n=1 Tax=Molorchus minor TaxID=1323400 RepID=A0ABQ9JZK4_9CUCU|nr:hypothetical protein NQ317_013318 [Molorchus minor]